MPLVEIRRIGAFFTGENLAQQLLARPPDVSSLQHVLDPACGCGDLLLALARHLPVSEDLFETLRLWGAMLHGIDREPEFIEAARHRLALLALVRGARPRNQEAHNLDSLLSGLQVGDGRQQRRLAQADVVLLNPPYGQIRAPASTSWGAGRITEAALWVDDALKVYAVRIPSAGNFA